MTYDATSPPRATGNRNALYSLGCALLACTPPGGVYAIVFGVRGVRFARANGRRGLFASILGITAGLACVALYAFVIGSIFVHANPSRRFVREFVSNLDKGDLSAALAQCDDTFSVDDVEALAVEVADLGRAGTIEFTAPGPSQSRTDNRGENRLTCCILGGTIRFAAATRTLDAALVPTGATYRLHRFKLLE